MVYSSVALVLCFCYDRHWIQVLRLCPRFKPGNILMILKMVIICIIHIIASMCIMARVRIIAIILNLSD
jgi:hypothetical protein